VKELDDLNFYWFYVGYVTVLKTNFSHCLLCRPVGPDFMIFMFHFDCELCNCVSCICMSFCSLFTFHNFVNFLVVCFSTVHVIYYEYLVLLRLRQSLLRSITIDLSKKNRDVDSMS